VDASSDRALVASLRRADPVAFGRVHAHYGPRLFNFLARLTGRKAIAEDLYQEMWLKLAVHAPRLEEDTDLGAWLYTVARNLAYSDRRRERVRPGNDAGELKGHEAAGGASPYDWASANQTEALVDRALADIPDAFREVLLLVIVAGLEPEQAAAVLNLKPDALRQRLSRARAKLAERLDELTRAPRARVEA
jgi:RNA polymerase sigma-70 factor (ECF subfamily)